MKRIILIVLVIIVAVFAVWAIIGQFMKVVDNPPVNGVVDAPANVRKILEKSCFDCHSNETKITWIQRLPIASWMVQSDVNGARSILNFTEWNKYSKMEQDGLIYLAVNAAISGGMPPEDFLMIHPDAKLTKEDKAALSDWLKSFD